MLDHLQDYLNMLRVEINSSPKTIEAYDSDIRRYLCYIRDSEGIESIDDIRPINIRSYVNSLSKMLLAPSTISRNIASVRSYHKFLKIENIESSVLELRMVFCAATVSKIFSSSLLFFNNSLNSSYSSPSFSINLSNSFSSSAYSFLHITKLEESILLLDDEQNPQ